MILRRTLRLQLNMGLEALADSVGTSTATLITRAKIANH